MVILIVPAVKAAGLAPVFYLPEGYVRPFKSLRKRLRVAPSGGAARGDFYSQRFLASQVTTILTQGAICRSDLQILA
jgi:hypothetical protein